MPHSKITTKHQITIPKSVFEKLGLKIGDMVEVVEDKGKAILIPQQMVSRAPATRLSKKEQEILTRLGWQEEECGEGETQDMDAEDSPN